MSPDETPSERVVPVPVPVPTSGEAVAENYVADQLQSARASLQRTRIIGIVLMVIVVGYLSWLTIKFQQELRPESAAETTNGLIAQQVSEQGPELGRQVQERVRAMIAGMPDYAMEQMPQYRTALEAQLESDLREHSQKTADLLGDHLDAFLDENKDKIKEILTTGQDREGVRALGASLEQELREYLKEKPASGESVQDQINKSLQALREVESTMRRLASGKNLNLQEKRTRRAIALIAKAADAELKRFEIKEISFKNLPINLPTGENSEQPAAGPIVNDAPATGGAATGGAATGEPAGGAAAGNTAGGVGAGANGNTTNAAAPGGAAK